MGKVVVALVAAILFAIVMFDLLGIEGYVIPLHFLGQA